MLNCVGIIFPPKKTENRVSHQDSQSSCLISQTMTLVYICLVYPSTQLTLSSEWHSGCEMVASTGLVTGARAMGLLLVHTGSSLD